MIFEYADYRWILGLLPVVMVVMWVGRVIRLRRRYTFVAKDIFHKLAPTLSLTRRFWKKGLLLLAFVLLSIAVLRPQYGADYEITERHGLNIFIAIDTSTSMAAEDIKPTRIEHAKREILGLMDNLKGDRIGLIAFAGDAFVQSPLTLDYAAARLFLNDIDTNTISVPGTDIATAIKTARLSFAKQKNKASDVLIIISDGESFENDPIESAKVAAEKGVTIYTVGIGTPTGEPIPVFDERGVQDGFKKDKDGNVVVSRLNQEMLQQIAEAANGRLFLSSNARLSMDDLYKEISRLDKDSIEEQLKKTAIDRYHWFLFPAFLVLLFEFCFSERKTALPEWRGRL